jgi:hypothetical protein
LGLPRYAATRYVLPLREGGSLPAIVDTDEPGQFVVKFRGAGQGPRALVAEVIAAGVARACGLPVPDAAVIELAEGFGLSEPDPEIQDLLRASVGLNFGLRYVPGALAFDPIVDGPLVDDLFASAIVWFDALIMNVDRTPRNPNLLVEDGRVWLIDHGASLYFHHQPGDWQARAADRFPLIREHILLPQATRLLDTDEALRPRLTATALAAVLASVPDEWLGPGPERDRAAYAGFFSDRLGRERGWLEEALRAREG